MDQETSKASFLGVGLTMIVAVIILGLAVFAVARGIMNSAQTSFVKTMDGASNSGLTDFDGTTISGVKVRSALEDYEGQPYMILINTAALQKKYTTDGKAVKATSGKDASTVKADLKVRENYGDTNNSELQLVAFSGREYVIYNAQLDLDQTNTFTDSKDGYISFEGAFKMIDGLIQYNVQKINWKTSGCTEYLSSSANFVAKLIKDPSGTAVGFLFTEVY